MPARDASGRFTAGGGGSLANAMEVRGIKTTLGMNTSPFSAGIASAAALVNPLTASIAAAGAAAITTAAALGAISLKAIKLAAEAEQASVSFTTMLGDAGEAQKLMAEINRFAAATPFETPGLIAAAKSLLAFNTEADQVIPTMRMLGDLSAGLNIPLGELAELYGKARVQGRLMAQDVNQLTGRGIPVIAEFAKQFGVAESEVRGLVESGQVNFRHLQKALADLTGEGGKFGGLMAAQSQTVSGLWSTLSDTLSMSTARLGQTIVENLDVRGVLTEVTRSLEALATAALPVIEDLLKGLGESGDIGKGAGELILTGAEMAAKAVAGLLDMVDRVKAGWYALKAAALMTASLIIEGLAKVIDVLGVIERKTGGVLSAVAGAQGGASGRMMKKAAEQMLAHAGETSKQWQAMADSLELDAGSAWDDAANAWKPLFESERAQAVADKFMEIRTSLAAVAEEAEAIEPIKIVEDTTVKKLEEMSPALKKLKDEAEQLAKSLMTPEEKWQEQITKLNAMLINGFITDETFDRGLKAADEEYKKATEVKGGERAGLASFIQGGSAEAAKYQAQLNLIAGGNGETEAKKQTGLLERVAEAVEEFNEEGGGDVVMDISRGYA